MRSPHAVCSLGLLLVLALSAGCATPDAPASAPIEPIEPVHQVHAHHSHHHGDAQTQSGHQPPTSFTERPEVGTEFTCPVSGGVFEVEPRTRVSFYQGRYYAMCCGGCAQDFDADPAHFVEALKQPKSAASHHSH